LQLNYDELPSTIAFKLNVRRYNLYGVDVNARGRAVQVHSIKTRFECALVSPFEAML
jgi:hypothetical protein